MSGHKREPNPFRVALAVGMCLAFGSWAIWFGVVLADTFMRAEMGLWRVVLASVLVAFCYTLIAILADRWERERNAERKRRGP